MENPEVNDVPGQMRLRDLKNGLYQIHHAKNGAFEGSLNPIFWKAVSWGYPESDLNFAIKLMKEKDHDYAEFGIFGGLIFTTKDEESKAG